MLPNATRSLIAFAIIITVSSFTAHAQADTIPKLPSGDSTIFTAVDKEAYFPGGEEAWKQFLIANLKADVPVRKKAPVGKYTVWIQFIVDTDGKVSDIKALTEWGYGMENEVMRLLRRSPKWIPAVLKGNPVKAYRKQPVTFMVEEEKTEKGKKKG